jgi:hypothetical protein
MGIDTAGWGQNYTVGFIVKEFKKEISTGLVNAYKLVAQYRRNRTMHDEDMLGLCGLIEQWQPNRIAVETQEGTGQITFQKLVGLYPDKDISPIKASDQSKPIMIARLHTALEEVRFTSPKSCQFSMEAAVFSDIDGKLGAPPGKNDDTVIAAALCLVAAPFNDGDNRLLGAVKPSQEDEDDEFGSVNL